MWGRYPNDYPPPDPKFPMHNPLKGKEYGILVDAYTSNPALYPGGVVVIGNRREAVPPYKMPKGTKTNKPVSF